MRTRLKSCDFSYYSRAMSPHDVNHEANREKSRVALVSLFAALGLTLTKLGVGWSTNSLGILSEALHSGLDLAAAGMTLWAVRAAARPPDRDHPYGHGKFENVSALFETALLLITCVWIGYEAIHRLAMDEPPEVNANIWAFGVIVLSIIVDFGRSRALSRAAKKHRSQALEADALHFSTDIWSSFVVLLGLGGVAMAERLGQPGLARADVFAALGVAVIVVWVSLKLGKKSLDDLVDRVPTGMPGDITRAAGEVDGVLRVEQVRVRRAGPEVFADVTVSVDRSEAFEGAHDVASRTVEAVRQVVPEADVVVHVDPVADETEEAGTTVRVVAARHGLAAHGIRFYREPEGQTLELHVEMDGSMALGPAHCEVTRFEKAVAAALPELTRVVTHIEPAGTAAAALSVAPAASRQDVEAALAEFLEADTIQAAPHDIHAKWAAGELAVSLHCILDSQTSVTDAHDFTIRLERFLRDRIESLGRVLIHVEPPEEDTLDGE